jgi:hypothetical protein
MSKAEGELRRLREDFAKKRNAFATLATRTDAVVETLAEIRLDHEVVADQISAAIAQNEKRRAAVVAALGNNTDLAPECPALAVAAKDAEDIAQDIDARLKSLRDPAAELTRKGMESELREMNARVLLGKHEQTLLDEIDRKSKFGAALHGYPLQGYAGLRNIFDNLQTTSAALQGMVDFYATEGIVPGQPLDIAKVRKLRKKTEHDISQLMAGSKSGLTQATIEELAHWD